MNGRPAPIWVTCSWMAAHFRSSGVAGDVDPGRDGLVGHEHLRHVAPRTRRAAPASRPSGGDQKLGLPSASSRSRIAVPDRGRDGLLVELRRRPRREPAGIERRAGAAVLRGELLRVPRRVAGPRERPDRDVVGPDVVGVAVAAEVVVGRHDVRLVAADEPDQPAGGLVEIGLPEASAGRGCRAGPSCRSRGSRGSPTRSRRGGPSPAPARRPGSRRADGGCPACPCPGRRSRPSRRGCRSRGRRAGPRRRPWPSSRRSRSSRRRGGRGRSSGSGRGGGGGRRLVGHGAMLARIRDRAAASRAVPGARPFGLCRAGRARDAPVPPRQRAPPSGTSGCRSAGRDDRRCRHDREPRTPCSCPFSVPANRPIACRPRRDAAVVRSCRSSISSPMPRTASSPAASASPPSD